MKLKLTDKTIRGLKPPAHGRLDVFDTEVKGLHLRLTAHGARAWRYVYRVATRQRVLTWDGALPLADARQRAREAAVAVARGGDPAVGRDADRAAPTVARVVSQYLAWRAARPEARPTTEHEVARIFAREISPVWGPRLLKDIRRGDVLTLLDGIVARKVGPMANRTRAALHTFFAWAVEREIVETNPVTPVKNPVKEEARTRVLTDDEVARLWPWLPPYGRLQLLVGSRGGELEQVRWGDVDLGARTIRFRREVTKTHAERIVPLSAPAVAILRELQATATGPQVFPGRRPGAPLTRGRSYVASALAAATIPAARPHDLRRTCASGLGRFRVPDLIISMILGHARPNPITGIYDRDPRLEECRVAMEKWGTHVAAVVVGEPTGGAVLAFRGVAVGHEVRR